MSKMILILVVGAFITYGIVNITSNDNVTNATENAADNYSLTKARNIANSTAEMILANLGDNINWRVTSPVTVNVLGGETIYKVEDAFFNGDSLIKISILGNYFNNLKTVTIYTLRNLKSPGFLPVNMYAPVTTNNNILTAGTITVDGRDHTMAGALIPNKGTWGIWTTKTFTQKGASSIGGTFYTAGVGTDIAPTKVGYMPVVAQNQTYPGGFPTTPEEVLGGISDGFDKDRLKIIAQRGIYGSQYVTDPTNLKYPLKGITYVEITDSMMDCSVEATGAGILIVHNKSLTASIKNINAGTFRGLIIADDIVHIQTTIIGAIFSLTPSPSEGNAIGLGNGSVLYSNEAIKEATEFAATHNFGWRKKRVAIKYWFE